MLRRPLPVVKWSPDGYKWEVTWRHVATTRRPPIHVLNAVIVGGSSLNLRQFSPPTIKTIRQMSAMQYAPSPMRYCLGRRRISVRSRAGRGTGTSS
jgi:hypothetical protein